jgi:8-oxo-dGTP diphosphatase
VSAAGGPGERPGEADWLARYDPRAYPAFTLTVDLAIFTIRGGVLCTLLVRRGEHPYRGWWALPGGHVQHGRESAGAAAARELAEETGIDTAAVGVHLEQLGAYTAPRRDPRIAAGLQVASVGYVALAPAMPEPTAASDAADARWWAVDDLDLAAQRTAWAAGRDFDGDAPALGYDHAVILSDAVERIRAKLEYSTLALQFVTEPFSLPELRRVYLAVWGSAPDLANFRRKVLATPGFVTPHDGSRAPAGAAGGRPPLLYRRGPATHLNPPISRG